ncbi:hypothetical protein NUM3379_42680 [Kineococcus sp. NUM-3379]
MELLTRRTAPPDQAAGLPPALRRTLTAVAAWSLLQALLALHWVLDPASWPWPDTGGLLGVLPPRPAAALLLVPAAALLLVLAARARPASRAAAAVAAVVACLLVALAADLGLLSLVGYLVAITCPAAFVLVFTAGAVRDRRSRPWALVLLAALAAGAAAGVLRPSAFSEIAGRLADGFAAHAAAPALKLVLLAGAVLWAFAAVLLRRNASGRCGACGRPGPRWSEPGAALRWGRVVTLVAAACPLPYALLRVTWLTPWPLGMPGDLDPAGRLFGLALGAAAVGGCVLTVGLLRPWGEVWPGWIPVLRGRPVPWRLPVVLGGTVAAVLLASTPAFLGAGVEALREDGWVQASFLLFFPTLPWGLALGAAVLAYAYRRRGTCGTCGRGAAPLSVRPAPVR